MSRDARQEELLRRVVTDRAVCGGRPCIRGTRIEVAVVIDGLAEGLSTDELLEHYPSLAREDVAASLAYAAELCRESVWKLASGS